MSYDQNNIFAKILRGEIPCNKVYEDEYALAFYDITPRAPTHVLIIPKGEYISFDDFSATAPAEAMVGFYRATQKVATQLGLQQGGYRALTNVGADALQEVMHYHLHLFAGCNLGSMVKPGLA